MKEFVSLETILNLFELEISKNVKNKHKVYMFEKNKFQNINRILDILRTGNYYGGKYNIFLIKEPKHRIVMALDIGDKLINHFIARYVLERKLAKYLDPRNIATRKEMGTDYGIKLLKKYIEVNKKYDDFYILKLDISKYFYSIDHEVLKEMVKDKLTEEEYNFLSIIIDSTNNSYINMKIKDIKEKYLAKHPHLKTEMDRLPQYDYGKGLPIGNMTSQFLSIFYLYELDHYIVHNLRVKYYIRYMDDFIIFDYDKERLKELKIIIEEKLKDFKLELNKKTNIYDLNHGFGFLGYNFILKGQKLIIKINSQTKRRIKKKMRHLRKVNATNYDQVKASYMGYLQVAHTKNLLKKMDL